MDPFCIWKRNQQECSGHGEKYSHQRYYVNFDKEEYLRHRLLEDLPS